MQSEGETSQAYVDPSLVAAVDYCCRITRDFFGEVPEKVCRFLFSAGPVGLREVRQGAGLSKQDCSKALITLVQHNYVDSFLFEEVAGARKLVTRFVYKANSARIIASIRQPAFLVHVVDFHGEWPERVCEQLAHNGRLSFYTIVQRIWAAESEGGEKEESDVEQEVASAVVRLFNERLIEQVPPCDLPLTDLPDNRPKASRSKPKLSDDDKKLEAGHQLSLEQYQKMRYRIPQEVLAVGLGGVEEVQADAATLIRLNFDAFAVHFQHEACVQFVGAGQGQDHEEVAQAILDITRPATLNALGKATPPRPASASREAIEARCALNRARDRDDQCMDVDNEPPVDVATALLGLHDYDMVQETEEGKELYVFDLQMASFMMQNRTIAGFLKGRFGEHGQRVWRLVLEHKYLASDHIEKMAMINMRQTRTVVYALFRHGYLTVQEVPKSSERAPSKCYYLYHADFLKTVAQFVADSYTAAGNLLARAAFELDKEKAVLELAQRKLRGDTIKMSAAQIHATTRLQHVVKTLHASLLRVDGMLATFTGY